MLQITERFRSGRLATGFVLTVLGVLSSSDPVAAQCVDYGDYLHLKGSAVTSGSVRHVAVSGDYAYFTDSDFHVADVRVPDQPVIVGSMVTSGEAGALAVQGVSRRTAGR